MNFPPFLLLPAKHKKSKDKLKTLKSDFDKVIECVHECASLKVRVCVPEGEFVKKTVFNGFFVCLSDRWMSCRSISIAWDTDGDSDEIKWKRSWHAVRKEQIKRKFKAGLMIWNYLSTPFSTTLPTFQFISLSFWVSLFPLFTRFLRPPTTRRAVCLAGSGAGRGWEMEKVVLPPPSLHLVPAQCCFSFGFNSSSFSMELHAKRRRHAMTDIDIGIVELQRGKSCDCLQMFY